MDTRTGVLLSAGLAVLLLLVSRQSNASIVIGDSTFEELENSPEWPYSPPTGDSTLDDKAGAFLSVIKKYESDDDYNIIVGGQHFTDYSRHPNVYVPRYNSTAAGAYQFIFPTWETWRKRLNLPDFSPDSQDRAAMAQLAELGILRKLQQNDINGALLAAGRVWASMPGSKANQGARPLSVALADYQEFLA